MPKFLAQLTEHLMLRMCGLAGEFSGRNGTEAAFHGEIKPLRDTIETALKCAGSDGGTNG